MPIRLVVFDLGNVLVRLVTSGEEACRLAGVQPTGPWDAARHHRVMCAFELGHISEDEYLAVAGECLANVGVAGVERIFDAWIRGPYPGAGELIAELKSRGLRTACLSNTTSRHWRIMTDPANECGRELAHLDHLFASHLLRAAKPDPAAYRAVELATGVCANEILFFDDRDENVRAAQSIGWQARPIDPTRDGVQQIRYTLAREGVL